MAHPSFLILLSCCLLSLDLSSAASLLDPNSTSPSSSFPHSSSDPLACFLRETSWYNDIVLGPLLPPHLRSKIPHTAQTWLRNYIAGVGLYFLSGFLWCLYIYHWKRHVFFPRVAIHKGLVYAFICTRCPQVYRTLCGIAIIPTVDDDMPSKDAMLLQIWVTMKAMPLYTALPTLSEHMIERGWTRCYCSMHDVGLLQYVLFTILYLALVEFGIYWMHRILHDSKPLYKWLHATHHIYNKENTLSPFAGLAFHPLDGILQACPHVIFIFVVPTHFFTHEFALFLEAVWTANIHDCIHGKVWPIMGAGYHTIHHTTYRHNYGHYTILMDWMFGTLRDPAQPVKPKKL